MRDSKLLFSLFSLHLIIGLIGCGGTPEGQRPTAPVEVTVTYKGKPVVDATVTFISVENPIAANGITNEQGVAILHTYQPKDGAVIGNHQITVTKVEIDKNVKTKPIDPSQADVVGYTPLTPLKSLIPKKYDLPGTSGLTAEVKKGSNKFPLELKD